ncbi:hypothetical protein BH23GEM2_BH23GEM2_02020 [soil metagenome]
MTAIISAPTALRNRTRVSRSIPLRLLREGKLHLLPLYAMARTSYLGREGMDSSGSFRFADHVYRGRPRGRFLIGWATDALFLTLPASRSMRERYLHSRSEIAAELRRAAATGRPTRILSVPCGIARELVEAANEMRVEAATALDRAELIGMDLDPEPLSLSRALAGNQRCFRFVHGDALQAATLPDNLDLVVSTGFGEFLDDVDLLRFYTACRDALRPGGRFVTSGMSRSRIADRLLREIAELHVHYRDAEVLRSALEHVGFAEIAIHADRFGLQSLVTASRPQRDAQHV